MPININTWFSTIEEDIIHCHSPGSPFPILADADKARRLLGVRQEE
jgi:hypothetical protein